MDQLHVYKRRQKKRSRMESDWPSEIIRVYERRNRTVASSEETVVRECNRMYMWLQGIREEDWAIMGES